MTVRGAWLLATLAAMACGSKVAPVGGGEAAVGAVRSPDASPVAVPPPAAAEVREVWAGTLVLPAELRDFVVTFVNRAGVWTATMDVPALGATGLTLADVVLAADSIGFQLRHESVRATEVYAFTRTPGSGDAVGSLTIGGQRLHARLVRLAQGEKPRTVVARPQTPRPPYPYAERDVAIEAPEAGKLAGTLTLPEGPGPFPAVLLISGSGQQDRDEAIFGHRPFRVIADRLTREGFAVLRTDDRGTGKTAGPLGSLETDIGDGRAAFEWLARQPEVDRRRVGILGHSVGGIIAPTIAARTRTVAFVIALAGPGVPGWELVASQLEAMLVASGLPGEGAARLAAAQRKVSRAAAFGGETALRAVLRESIIESARVVGAPEPTAAELDAQIAAALPALTSPWVVSFYRYDPLPAWRKVKCPVLALIGDKDLQVPADVNLAAIGGALRKAGNRDVTTRKLPGLNHLYQRAATGVVEEYGEIDETFDPATLDEVAGWLAARMKR